MDSVIQPLNNWGLKYFSVQDMFPSIGEEKLQVLLAFHAFEFEGCDQIPPSALYGKKTARKAWGAIDNVM